MTPVGSCCRKGEHDSALHSITVSTGVDQTENHFVRAQFLEMLSYQTRYNLTFIHLCDSYMHVTDSIDSKLLANYQ